METPKADPHFSGISGEKRNYMLLVSPTRNTFKSTVFHLEVMSKDNKKLE